MDLKYTDKPLKFYKEQLKATQSKLAQTECQKVLVEQRYQRLLDHLKEQVHTWNLIKNKDGTIKTWELADANNAALLAWQGSKETLLGKQFDDIFGQGSTEKMKPVVAKMFKTGRCEEWIEYFQKTDQYLSMTSVPMGDSFIATGRDIREQIEAEKHLRQSEKLLKQSERISKQGSWRYDIQKKTWNFSKNWLALFGFKTPPTAKELQTLVDPRDMAEVNLAVRRAIEGHEKYEIEHRVTPNITGVFWVKVSAKLETSNQGKPTALIGFTRDITKEKEAELKLTESESFLEQTGAIAKIGGWRLEGDFKKAYWTRGTYDIHELPYDYEPSMEESINFYHPDDRDMVATSVSTSMKTGEPFCFEARIISAKNNEKWVLAKGESRVVNGKCVRLSGVVQDISAEKKTKQRILKSEEKFKTIFQNSAVAKILTDDEGHLLDANKRCSELLGYTYQELMAMSIQDLVHEDTGLLKKHYFKVKKHRSVTGVIEVICKDGTLRSIEHYTKKLDERKHLSTFIDITGRLKAEEASTKAKYELLQITKSIPGTIYQFVFHKDGHLSMPFISETAADLLGFPLEQMKELEFLFSRIHPEDLENVMHSINAVNKDQAEWNATFRAMNHRDEIRWISGHSLGTINAKGQTVHHGVLFDVTDQKQGELDLRASQQQYQNIADNISGVVLRYKLNPDGTDDILYISRGCQQLFEIAPELAMTNPSLIWQRIYEEDVNNMMPSIQESAKNMSVWEYEYRLLFPDARIKWVHLRGVPELQEDGSIVWDTVGLEITERKQAERALEKVNRNLEKLVEERAQKAIQLSKELELYWLAAEQAKVGVWHYDLRDNSLIWDDTMYELYGVDKKEFSGAYEAWEHGLHHEDKERAIEDLQTSIAEKTDFDSRFRVVHSKTGKIAHIRAKGKLEFDNEGHVMGVYGTNWDVSQEMIMADEKEQALNKLTAAQAQLIQSEKMASLGILTAGMAHELNNPLNYILGGYTTIMDQLETDAALDKDEIKENLGWIKSGANRATDIVKSLNLFSRTYGTNTEECDVQKIIQDCLMILRNKLSGSIRVSEQFSEHPIIIKGNIGKLHQAFLNVLSNAIEAAPKTDALLSIVTKIKDQKVTIVIGDNGTGISKENLDKVMDPFYTTKSPGMGTGLGLSVTHSIIKDHQGHLEILSVLNRGTEVIVTLPIHTSDGK